MPQAHVPEHHSLLGQWGWLGLGRGCAGLWVKRERSEPGTGQQTEMGSARTQPTHFRIPRRFQTLTTNTLDLKKSKIQNKSSNQSPRPCHQRPGLEGLMFGETRLKEVNVDSLSWPALMGSQDQGQRQGKACFMGQVCCLVD